jgi:enoyl-CoA hydratase/carnithine racemase
MVCDLVVADETARFGTPETAVGLVPGLGILRGRAHVNLHWLKYMILTGRSLDAEQARLAGLVQMVVPPGAHLEEAARWGTEIAARSPLAVSTAKAFLGNDVHDRFEDAVATVTMLQGSDDLAEGVAAFTERRPPVFSRT